MSEGAQADLIDAAPRISNRRVLLVGVVLAVVVALAFGTVTVVNAVSGGAWTPQSLARRLVSAVDAGRPDRVLALLEPRERQAAVRLAGALDADLTRWGLQEMVGGAAGSGGSAVDGVAVHLDGVGARTELLSADVAALSFDTGQARVRVDPARAHGALRAYLDVRRTTSASDRTISLQAAGSGLRVMAVREGGRWYASLLLTWLERNRGSDQNPRLTAPASLATGADSPQQAAELMTDAATAAYSAGDLSLLAPALDHEGSVAAAAYGADFGDGLVVTQRSRVSSTFDIGSEAPDRSVVRVGEVILGSGADRVDVSPTCFIVVGARWCFPQSLYRYADGYVDTDLAALVGRSGPDGRRAFGLTAVRDDGSWRIGVADSVADAAIDAIGTLTREQVLALTGRVRLDTPSGTLVPDRAENAAFTSAGYLVRTLRIERAGLYRIAPSPTGTNRGAVYTADGTPATQKFFPNDDSYDLALGDYTVVLWADDAFADVLSGARPGPYRQLVEIRRVDA